MTNKKQTSSFFKFGCALTAFIFLGTHQTTYTRTETTIPHITAENRSNYEIKFKRETKSLSGKTLQPPTGPLGFQGEKIVGPDSGVVNLDLTPIKDINKEDIREFSVHLKDANQNWNELGRVYVGISCNMAVLGNISVADYRKSNIVDTFDNFECNQAAYDRIRGNQLANPNIRTSWGYAWLPLPLCTAILTDGTKITYDLYSGLEFNFSTSGFLFQVTATEEPKAGSQCTVDNQPGQISAADGKCHRIFCTTAENLPGFKDEDNQCIPKKCSLVSNNNEINGNPGLEDARGTCKAYAGLPCVLGDDSEGTTDATGLCTRKAGQSCTVPDSHGSKGITIAGGTCVGKADEPCMTKEGLGGTWNYDGKICMPAAGKQCILADKTTGTMNNEAICVKNKGEACTNKEFSAEGIADGNGECIPTIGESCLLNGANGIIDSNNNCKTTGKTIGANQACKDPVTSADGLMGTDGKCVPTEGARCLGENAKEGIIVSSGKCSTDVVTTPKIESAAKENTASSGTTTRGGRGGTTTRGGRSGTTTRGSRGSSSGRGR